MSSSSSVCECCLANDARLELDFEYVRRGSHEIYANMLLDCFNLKLSHSGGLICNACVRRLRDACRFRRLVLGSQAALSERRAAALCTPTTTAAAGQVKLEADSDSSYYDFHSDTAVAEAAHYFIKKEPLASWSSDDDATLLSVRAGKLHPENCKRKTEKCRRKKSVLNDRSRVKIAVKDVKVIKEVARINKKSAFTTNSLVVITCSNATPFNGNTPRGYRCFYCPRCFTDPGVLREHTRTEHTNEKQIRILSKYSQDNYMVYLDITDLMCTVCQQKLTDLGALRSHLITSHDEKLYVDCEERDIPFKLTVGTCECQKCDQKFETFGALERHMNIHFRYYICAECEAGFITRRRLQAHSVLSHTKGAFPCTCGKTFSSRLKLKLHEDAVHKLVPRFKCSQCTQRFFDYYKRQEHLVAVHNAPPLRYKCNVCERIFDKKSSLNKHTKNYHLQERNFACELCSYKSFSNHEMKSHMIKHTGERVHECEVCKKSYARIKTLKEHMRIHNNDRRFSCDVCGQAFVQKCSLKGHIKSFHAAQEVSLAS